MKIGIASDHRGVTVKKQVIDYLEKKGYTVENFGTDSLESVHYPVYAFKIGEAVAQGQIQFGILLCGTGIGMSIACNKVSGVRCAKVDSAKDAYYTRNDNDANVIALRSTMSFRKMRHILDTFLETPFSNEERHRFRVEMINQYKNV